MEEIKIYAECPHCKVDLEYHDQLNVDYDDMYYSVIWSAFCPKCQSDFLIREDYKLAGRTFIG